MSFYAVPASSRHTANRPLSFRGYLDRCHQYLQEYNYTEALDLVECLQPDHPQEPLLPFFQGFSLDKLGRYDEALEAYDRCLDLAPDSEEAWHNKALILHRLDRNDETNFHLVKCLRLRALNRPDSGNLPGNGNPDVNILEQTEGRFGPVAVNQSPNTRYLTIKSEREGSFWLRDGQPSNIPASDYICGLMPAAAHFQAQHNHCEGLMLGLGAGAGVIAMLSNFAQLHLTVVEIDPKIIELTSRHFPLINQFINEGRLTILCRDAFDYVNLHSRDNQPNFDFVAMDLAKGNNQIVQRMRTPGFLQAIARIAKLAMVNLMAPDSPQTYQEMLQDFEHGGVPLKCCYPTGARGIAPLPFQNRLLYSTLPNHAEQFVPYADDDSYLARAFRRDYQQMLRNREIPMVDQADKIRQP